MSYVSGGVKDFFFWRGQKIFDATDFKKSIEYYFLMIFNFIWYFRLTRLSYDLIKNLCEILLAFQIKYVNSILSQLFTYPERLDLFDRLS